MQNHVYKLTEIVGSSLVGHDDAIKVALERARASIRNIRWFEVVGERGYVQDNGDVLFQVTMKIGFTLDG